MTDCSVESGWGSGSFGAMSFGGGDPDPFGLVEVSCVRENVMRFTFNAAVYFSLMLDGGDASDRKKYTIAPVQGTVGYNGEPARPVFATFAELVIAPGVAGTAVDVYVDRPFTPYPARYLGAVVNVRSVIGDFSDPCHSSASCPAVYRNLQVQSPDAISTPKDIAISPPKVDERGRILRVFGGYSVDSRGDYAFEQGAASLRKRILRRLMTMPGGFAFLGPGYGIGLPGYIKHLNTAAARQRLITQASTQIMREPEVSRVSVDLIVDAAKPNLGYLRVKVRVKSGTGYQFDFPIPVGGNESSVST